MSPNVKLDININLRLEPTHVKSVYTEVYTAYNFCLTKFDVSLSVYVS